MLGLKGTCFSPLTLPQELEEEKGDGEFDRFSLCLVLCISELQLSFKSRASSVRRTSTAAGDAGGPIGEEVPAADLPFCGANGGQGGGKQPEDQCERSEHPEAPGLPGEMY